MTNGAWPPLGSLPVLALLAGDAANHDFFVFGLRGYVSF